MKHKIIFRADGHSKMGLGHVFRSLALAEMLKDEFQILFAIKNPLPILREKIVSICDGIIEIDEKLDNLEDAQYLLDHHLTDGSEIVVLDGYHFDTDYQKIIRKNRNKLVCIDDIYAYHFLADVVINHAGGLSSSNYSAELYTQFSLGLQYALLRKPFRDAALNRADRTVEDGCVFICLGGADPNNDTLEVLKICEERKGVNKCIVVLGGAYEHKKVLKEYIKESKLDIETYSNLSAPEMVSLMSRSEMAITPPSTISYEYLSVGGVLYLRTIADNQKNIHKYFVENGIALDFSSFLENVDPKEVLTNQQKLFDGKQQKRLLKIFRALTLNVRKATADDLMLYYNWANDPMSRQQSFNSEPISLENHTAWFSKKVISNHTVMYVMERNDKPVGQIRFDINEGIATISYGLDKDSRGLGLGEGLLRSGVAAIIQEYKNLNQIIGYVKKSNIPSIKAFRAINSKEEDSLEYDDSFKYIVYEKF